VSFERATIAGMTNYTGVSLADIEVHLSEWESNTAAAARKLDALASRISQAPEKFKNPREVDRFCRRYSDLFQRYAADFHRLVAEMSNGVRESHVKLVRQLYEDARIEDNSILRFRNDFVYTSLPDESVRPLLDDVYSEAREVMIDFQDLSNLAARLETFVGLDAPSKEVLADLHLKPNFFGIGLNLNRILARFKNRKRS
jgi:hypothetical protein